MSGHYWTHCPPSRQIQDCSIMSGIKSSTTPLKPWKPLAPLKSRQNSASVALEPYKVSRRLKSTFQTLALGWMPTSNKRCLSFFSTKRDGDGIGLAMVERIIKAHNAEIQVRSAPNEGATFVVRLPIWNAST